MDERAKLERLTFFSDAVFAIAMTLLVIEVRVPHLRAATDHALARALADLLPNYIGFVVSFVVIARFWIGHHRVMAMVQSADMRLVAANFGLLMTIAFMPFPTAVLSDYASLKVAIVLLAFAAAMLDPRFGLLALVIGPPVLAWIVSRRIGAAPTGPAAPAGAADAR